MQPFHHKSGTEEFWGQRSEVFHRNSFSSPTHLEIRQELASSESMKDAGFFSVDVVDESKQQDGELCDCSHSARRFPHSEKTR
ncbi:hypothetical protein F7725_020323 [Dissostichus mawsoni]|uniref:Uncharacterized protein n=1 Tax=Dissostichus mawsoni TaxID=36200 RepID=A0A7J5YCZ3_DISMA|nr:hypothetical protein F7725_020323 [Dissostichus mawsoni]